MTNNNLKQFLGGIFVAKWGDFLQIGGSVSKIIFITPPADAFKVTSTTFKDRK